MPPSLLTSLCSLLPWLRRIRPDLCPEIAYFSWIAHPGTGGESTYQEDVFAVDPRSGAVRRLTDDRTRPEFVSDRNPAWAPDRRSLAIHRGTAGQPGPDLVLISAADGATLRTLVSGGAPVWLDSGTLLFLAHQSDVWTVDLATLAKQRISDLGAGVSLNGLSWHSTAGLAIGWSEAGVRDSIATVPAAAVAAARAPGGAPVGPAGVTFVTGAEVYAASPDWSPAADRIALSTWSPGQPGRVGYLTLSSGSLTLQPGDPTPGTHLTDYGAVFSPDGRTLAWLRGYEDTWSEIWVADLPAGTTRRLTDDGQQRFKAGLDW